MLSKCAPPSTSEAVLCELNVLTTVACRCSPAELMVLRNPLLAMSTVTEQRRLQRLHSALFSASGGSCWNDSQSHHKAPADWLWVPHIVAVDV